MAARLELVFGALADRVRGDGVLLRGLGAGAVAPPMLVLPPAGPHPLGCRCCGGRDPWAQAIGGWLIGLAARGGAPIARVLAVLQGADAARLQALVEGDRLLAARLRCG